MMWQSEAGISRRYLQKLFAMRNSTYTHFINSVRLDHAADLLQRRAALNTTQPISAIAYASGFGDYTNFARQFQKRFGHSPGRTPNVVANIRNEHAYTACLFKMVQLRGRNYNPLPARSE